MIVLILLIGLSVAVLVASAIHRSRRPVPLDPIQLHVTNGMLIPGEYDIEAEDLREQLVATGDAVLVEHRPDPM